MISCPVCGTPLQDVEVRETEDRVTTVGYCPNCDEVHADSDSRDVELPE